LMFNILSGLFLLCRDSLCLVHSSVEVWIGFNLSDGPGLFNEMSNGILYWFEVLNAFG
jgi:hypothetical protein